MVTREEPADPSASTGTQASLRERVFGGLVWMYLAQGSTAVLQIVVLAVLARLVAPREFGLVAATLVVVTVGNLLAEAGLDTAIVQRRELTEQHVRSAFGASLALGIAMGAAFYTAAPWMAGLYGMPELTPLIQMMAIVFPIEGAGLGRHLLLRELRFRPVAVINTLSFAVGYGGVAAVLAMRGWGAEAIIAGHVGQSLLAIVGFWIVRPHTPWATLSPRPLADLFRVGAGETLSRVIGTVGLQGDSFIVGRWLGAAALGFYSRAYRLMEMPTQLLTQAIRQVLFPAMASFQDDTERLGRTYLTGIGILTTVTLPVSVGLAFVAEDAVRVVLGPDWVALVPTFQVLVFGMVFRAGPAVSDSVILACGAVYRQAARVAVFAVLVVVGAFVGQGWGILGVAWGILLAMGFNFLAMAYISLSLTGVTWRAFFAAQVPALHLGAAVAIVAAPTAALLHALGAAPVLVVAAVAAVSLAAVVMMVRVAPSLPLLSSLAGLTARVLQLVPGRLGALLERVVGRRVDDMPTPDPDASPAARRQEVAS